MSDLNNWDENLLRLSFFIGGLALFSLLGMFFSFRSLNRRDGFRWLNNVALTLVNSLIVRLVLPVTVVSFASENTYGLFHYFSLPFWLNLALSILVLDMIIYFQHLIFHRVPILWRLHAVHHADTNFDTSTALRFHPIEILLSLGIKTGTVLVFGIHPVALLIFEIILNFSAMFNHGNFSLPNWLEKSLVKLIVTPDFHRIHHSIVTKETHSNFGFFLAIWDYLFKTARSRSINDLKTSQIGLTIFRAPKNQTLFSLLSQPFRKQS